MSEQIQIVTYIVGGVLFAFVGAGVFAWINRGNMASDDLWFSVLISCFVALLWPLGVVALLVWLLARRLSRKPEPKPKVPAAPIRDGRYR